MSQNLPATVTREEILKSLTAPLVKALDGKGITPDLLANKLFEELEAKETKIFQYQGTVIDHRDVVAWDVRPGARMDAHRLRGDYPSEKVDVTVRPLLVITDPEDDG